MINFRFHLASLIAIFLALALGVVVGAGVIDRGVVDTLNGRLDSVESKANRIQGENDVLRGEVAELTDAIGAMECPAVNNTMLAEDVGIVAVRGVDDARVKDTIAAATCGGGTVTGTLWLEDKWALANDDDVAEMAQAVGSSSKRKETVRTAAWKQLVERLQSPPPPGDLSTDFLTTLEDAEFVTFEPAGEDPTQIAQFPRRNASTLLVVGNDAVVPEKDVVMPAATAFVAAGVPLVVAEVYAAGDDAPPRGEALVPLARQPARQVGIDGQRPGPSPGADHRGACPRRSAPRPAPGRPLRDRRRRHHAAARPLAVRRVAFAGAAALVAVLTVAAPAHGATGAERARRSRACSSSRSRTSSGPICKASTCPTSTACSRHRRSVVS